MASLTALVNLMVLLHAGHPPAFEAARVGPDCVDHRLAVRTSPETTAAFLRSARLREVRRLVLYVPGFATGIPKGLRSARLFSSIVGPADLVLYVDWGSLGKKLDYPQDERTVKATAPTFADWLQSLHRSLPGREIDIFAHSLGTRLVALALAHLAPLPDRTHVVTRAVLAAPDMTIADYTRAILRKPEPVGHVTLYVSRHDKALLLSTGINLHRRLGRLVSWRPIARTDVVDASAASYGDGHGYAISEPALIADIGRTLAGEAVPHRAWKRSKPNSINWTYLPPPGELAPPKACP